MTSHTTGVADLGLPEKVTESDEGPVGRGGTGDELHRVEPHPMVDVTGHGLQDTGEGKLAKLQPPRLSGTGRIDAGLITKARELVDTIEPQDAFETPLCLTALAGAIMEMWESAADSSQIHQDILATLENAVRLRQAEGDVAGEELSAFREALGNLSQERLVRENADVIRSRFVRLGFGPLGFVETEGDNRGADSD